MTGKQNRYQTVGDLGAVTGFAVFAAHICYSANLTWVAMQGADQGPEIQRRNSDDTENCTACFR